MISRRELDHLIGDYVRVAGHIGEVTRTIEEISLFVGGADDLAKQDAVRLIEQSHALYVEIGRALRRLREVTPE